MNQNTAPKNELVSLMGTILQKLSWRGSAATPKPRNYPTMVTASPNEIEAWNKAVDLKNQHKNHYR